MLSDIDVPNRSPHSNLQKPTVSAHHGQARSTHNQAAAQFCSLPPTWDDGLHERSMLASQYHRPAQARIPLASSSRRRQLPFKPLTDQQLASHTRRALLAFCSARISKVLKSFALYSAASK